MGHYKELLAYQKAYQLAMKVFHTSKKFPPGEKYSLIDQIRRSSRSVCTNLAEAHRRKRYKDYFISKLNDAETENAETEDCNYIAVEEHEELISLNTEVGKLTWFMISNPEKFK